MLAVILTSPPHPLQVYRLFANMAANTSCRRTATPPGSNKFVGGAIKRVVTPDPIVALTETTNFIHTDHLVTSRQASDDMQTEIWR